MSRLVDVDDTRRCPLGRRCAGCGQDGRGARLAVWTADTPLGVLCATVCQRCARTGRLPTVSVTGAAQAVYAHCAHLGVDLDQAAQARRAKDGHDGRERWR
jgi:hypothetical protein